MNNKTKNLLIAILILAFFIKIVCVFEKELYYDESSLLFFLEFGEEFPHPFLSIFFLKIAYLFSKTEVWVLRIVPLLFTVFNSLLIFKIGEKIYNTKVAVASLLLYLFLFWPLSMGVSIDHDGTSLLFTILLASYFYLNYRKEQSKKNAILFGVALGLSFLTKNTALIMTPIFFLDLSIQQNLLKNREKIFSNILPFFIAFAILASYTVITSQIWPEEVESIIKHSKSSVYFSLIPNLFIFIYLGLFATPILIFPFILQILKRKKEDLFCFIWFIIYFIVYLFSHHIELLTIPFDRYLIVIFPPLAFLSGKYLVESKINIKSLIKYFASFLLIFNFIFITYNPRMVDHDPIGFITVWKDGDFLFPITSNQQPFIQLPFSVLVTTYFLSFILFLLMIRKNKKAVVIFVALLASYNFVLIEQYAFKINYIDYDESVRAAKGIIDLENPNSILVNNEALYMYARDKKINEISIFRYTNIDETYTKENSLLIISENLKIPEEKVERLTKNCSLIKSLQTNNYLAMRAYKC